MEEMWFKKGQYISLKDKPVSNPDSAEKKYRLFSPRIQVSGSRRGRGWKPSRGIFIQKGSDLERSPLVDLGSILRAVVYGISFVVFAIGRLFKSPGGGGQLNGGQA
jgi:hypothetical protein